MAGLALRSGFLISVSNLGQPTARPRATLVSMLRNLEIVSVEMDGTDGLIVTFSDGTEGAYVVEELLGLRPNRERTKEPKHQGISLLPSTLN